MPSMFRGLLALTRAVSARLEVDRALTVEQVGCEHSATGMCQDCYLQHLADRW